jgi:hypothetical protein
MCLQILEPTPHPRFCPRLYLPLAARCCRGKETLPRFRRDALDAVTTKRRARIESRTVSNPITIVRSTSAPRIQGLKAHTELWSKHRSCRYKRWPMRCLRRLHRRNATTGAWRVNCKTATRYLTCSSNSLRDPLLISQRRLVQEETVSLGLEWKSCTGR